MFFKYVALSIFTDTDIYNKVICKNAYFSLAEETSPGVNPFLLFTKIKLIIIKNE